MGERLGAGWMEEDGVNPIEYREQRYCVKNRERSSRSKGYKYWKGRMGKENVQGWQENEREKREAHL